MSKEEPKYLPPVPLRAIGASYLIRQVAGSERVGGLSVTLKNLDGTQGELQVRVTDWMTDEPQPDADEMDEFVNAAIDGVRSMVDELELEGGTFDTILHRFFYHPVDSDPRVYRQAGRSAFRAALEALRSRDVPL